MSRSYRKRPFISITKTESEKEDKRRANRRLRRKLRQIPPDDDAVLPLQREVSNVWSFGKDGKRWMSEPDPRWLRK